MGKISIDLNEMERSANNLMQAKNSMHDELRSLDGKMNVVRDMVSVRLKKNIEAFEGINGEVLKNFERMDELKAEFDAAVKAFRIAEGLE